MEKKEENNKWLKVYKDNYNGKSEEAKEIAGYLNETYNGSSYIPWATMERLTYMQDPNAEFETISNEKGNIVWTDTCENYNKVIADDLIKNGSTSVMFSHFVKVKLTFLGKVFVEEYPIQDQDYSALKIYNQNSVNKALKRALAKVASRATGLGLRLYENKDLQFEEDKENKKPVVKSNSKTEKTVEKVETPQPIVETTPVQVKQVSEQVSGQVDAKVEENASKVEETITSASYSQDVLDLCKLIKDTPSDKMTKVLQSLNVAILKQHGFVLSQEDSDLDLCEKLSHFKDVNVFTRAINNMLG